MKEYVLLMSGDFIGLIPKSVPMEAVLLLTLVFRGVSRELVIQALFYVLEILPRALGSNLQATLWVSSPAVVPLVEEVVRVGIMDSLDAIVT